MSVCRACGQENPDGFRFCGSCGEPLADAPIVREARKVVTVLFCDVTGSTGLGERLDPESLRRVLSRYFDAASTAVQRHGGSVEKFIGDAVMAVFGVPTVHEDDALRAVRAALEMQDAVTELNAELEHDFGISLEIRIGVNSGEVVAGTAERLATGDAVNVAARLEQVAGPGQILIGEETFAVVADAVEQVELPPVELRGKPKPLRVWRVVGLRDPPDRDLGSPMVGRQDELERLAQTYRHAVRDRACHLFTLLGSAGVGKSRLVHEFLSSLTDASVVRGRCLSYGEGITYWPVVETITQLERLDSWAEADPRAIGTIGVLTHEDAAATAPPEIAWAYRRLLEALALRRPLVVVFDDVHWGAPAFLDLVEHVADMSRDAPILLLCIARPELLDVRPGWSGGKLNATTVLLEPLDAMQMNLLIDQLLSGASLDPQVRAKVQAAAEGNPLFCEQIVALARNSAGGEPVEVPATIRALLAARLDQLDPGERRILEHGAVEGRVFHRGAVSALVSEPESVLGGLTALVRKELVRPDSAQIPGEDAFRFRHLLIRDAAYDALPKASRADLHKRFAIWLSEHGRGLAELDEICGYHYEQAHRYRGELGPIDDEGEALAAQAAERLGAAGRRAMLRGDYGAATNLLERADRLRPDVELADDLVWALRMNGRIADAVALADAAAERAENADDQVGALRLRIVARQFAAFAGEEGTGERLEELFRVAHPLFESAGDQRALTTEWLARTTLAHEHARWGEVTRAGETAARYAEACGDQARLQFALMQAVIGHAYGPTPASEALAQIEAARSWNDPYQMLGYFRAEQLAMLGRFADAREQVADSRSRQQELGLMFQDAISSQARATVELLAGDLHAAEREAREGCEQLEALGELGFYSTNACMLADILIDLDRATEAEHWVARGRETGPEDDVVTQILWRQIQARLLARKGDHEQALTMIQAAIDRADLTDAPNQQADAYRCLSEVLASTGDSSGAVSAMAAARDRYAAKENVVMAKRAERELDRLKAASSRL